MAVFRKQRLFTKWLKEEGHSRQRGGLRGHEEGGLCHPKSLVDGKRAWREGQSNHGRFYKPGSEGWTLF